MLGQNVSLQPYHTFGVAAHAKWFCQVQSPTDWQWLTQQRQYHEEKKLILGEGSNVLFRSDFNGLVIRNLLKGIETVDETPDRITLRVQSGESWNELVEKCVQLGYGGIENLALIPGTCGAAPIQNIGAYGAELKDVLQEVNGIDLASGKPVAFPTEACAFGYRESVFKQAWREKIFISSITLTLTKKNHRLRTSYGAIGEQLRLRNIHRPTIADIRDVVVAIRSSKLPDPRVLGNAGSFFKNPTVAASHFASLQNVYGSIPGYTSVNQNVKISAAWLIEQCGWKGKRVGNVGVHAQQALVLVHYGGAGGDEIFALATAIMHSVKEKFGIELSVEVNIV